MIEAGSEFEERLEGESPLGEARVRDAQPRLVHGLVPVQEQVEVDRPRSIAWAVARPSQLALDREQPVEELPRRQRGLERDGGVQEARLVLEPDGVGLAEGRDGHDLVPQEIDRTAHVRLAVAEVGPEPNVGASHGRSTVAAVNSTGRSTSGLRTRTRTHCTEKRS